MRIKPCWSCGSDGQCYVDCMCAKCMDPEGYGIWKHENPDAYNRWLTKQEKEYNDESPPL